MSPLDSEGYTRQEVDQLFTSETSLERLPGLLHTLGGTEEAMQAAISLCINTGPQQNVDNLFALQQLSSMLELAVRSPEDTLVYLGAEEKERGLVNITKTIYLARKGNDFFVHPIALGSTPGEYGSIDAYRVTRGAEHHLDPQSGISLNKIRRQRPGRRGGPQHEHVSHTVQVACLSFDENQIPIRQGWPSAMSIVFEYNSLQTAIRNTHKRLRVGF